LPPPTSSPSSSESPITPSSTNSTRNSQTSTTHAIYKQLRLSQIPKKRIRYRYFFSLTSELWKLWNFFDTCIQKNDKLALIFLTVDIQQCIFCCGNDLNNWSRCRNGN
jgi:hypothetical protein